MKCLLSLLVVCFGGSLALAEGVQVALAAQTNGTLGIPVYPYKESIVSPEAAECIRFVVVVTNERQAPIYFYSPHHAQGGDLIAFEVRDNISCRTVERKGVWFRSLPNQILELQPRESVFLPIALPSSEWDELNCAPTDFLRAGFRYDTTREMSQPATAFSPWYRVKRLFWGLEMAQPLPQP